jgi:uncharacterized small protein (DUF1192 family)
LRSLPSSGDTRAKTETEEIQQMPDPLLNIADIDQRIAILKENLRELVEQSASYSGAADEDLVSRRIAEQEAELELLTKRRDELSQTRS